MNVIIRPLSETKHSLLDIYDFIRDVYTERAQTGIVFEVSRIPFDEFQDKVNADQRIILVAELKNEIVGTVSLKLHKDHNNRNYAGLINLAVSSNYQRMGIASSLLSEFVSKACQNNCKYIISTTAESATSSVKWHLNNGFKKYKLSSYSNSKYYSLIFIKYINNSTKSNLLRTGQYYISFVFTKLLYMPNGSPSLLGKLGSKIKRMIK